MLNKTSILFFTLFSVIHLNAQFAFYGGTVEYELYSPMGVNGNMFIRSDVCYNCSMFPYSVYSNFTIFNYPTSFPYGFGQKNHIHSSVILIA